MAAHSTLTGADLHEPKGVASANSGEVYVANGAGSGAWTGVNALNEVRVTREVLDISTAGSYWIVPGIAGSISKIYSVIDGAIATGDATLSFEIAGVPVTDGNIVIANVGSAAGDVDSSTPSAANTITAAQAVEIITDGGSANTVKAAVTLVIDVS